MSEKLKLLCPNCETTFFPTNRHGRILKDDLRVNCPHCSHYGELAKSFVKFEPLENIITIGTSSIVRVNVDTDNYLAKIHTLRKASDISPCKHNDFLGELGDIILELKCLKKE
jgi:DNA-directed RNA polymerase subunit RPC12/RpoP